MVGSRRGFGVPVWGTPPPRPGFRGLHPGLYSNHPQGVPGRATDRLRSCRVNGIEPGVESSEPRARNPWREPSGPVKFVQYRDDLLESVGGLSAMARRSAETTAVNGKTTVTRRSDRFLDGLAHVTSVTFVSHVHPDP